MKSNNNSYNLANSNSKSGEKNCFYFFSCLYCCIVPDITYSTDDDFGEPNGPRMTPEQFWYGEGADKMGIIRPNDSDGSTR